MNIPVANTVSFVYSYTTIPVKFSFLVNFGGQHISPPSIFLLVFRRCESNATLARSSLPTDTERSQF